VSDLHEALSNPNCAAFLRMIRAGETSQDDDAYRMLFGGALFDGFEGHPNIKVTRGALTSTAAGAYQFLQRTWDECVRALGLGDFSPASQDLAAVYLIKRRGALADVLAGRFDDAVRKCAREWASLPGSPYGQPTKTLAQARAVYEQFGGQYAAQEGKTMPLAPIMAAVLPSIVEAIPKLGRLFGSGSAVAERNVKAAELAVSIVQDATGAVNAQEAAEKVKADPSALHAAVAAVEQRWYELAEAGGGGIEGARKADAEARKSGDIPHSPSFWITLALLPLVYLVVGSVVGLWGDSWPSDVRAAIATAIVSLIVGGAAGYYWGQTTSRNRTTEKV
jgi:muramidase (phage lysozyme)